MIHRDFNAMIKVKSYFIFSCGKLSYYRTMCWQKVRKDESSMRFRRWASFGNCNDFIGRERLGFHNCFSSWMLWKLITFCKRFACFILQLIPNPVYLFQGIVLRRGAKGTGMKSIELALSMCDIVDIYGFTVDPGYTEW